eukprot:TRINITY_DN13909_c0_g1_i3.p1 TRINITY_DN13909_c0_g1~~TRINITY_DN13909_c0_g1_i3.p1  ORF type:complete len:165 (+),score=18.77 TRINITY_DN13909_c0_g1_i3:56-550(+)
MGESMVRRVHAQLQSSSRKKWHYTMVDTSGHRDLSTNMTTGAPQADGAQIREPTDGDFETVNRLLENFVREERRRSVTIACISKEELMIDKKQYVTTEAAWHYDFIRNMTTREFQVDGALNMNLADCNYTIKDFNKRNMHTFLPLDGRGTAHPQKLPRRNGRAM